MLLIIIIIITITTTTAPTTIATIIVMLSWTTFDQRTRRVTSHRWQVAWWPYQRAYTSSIANQLYRMSQSPIHSLTPT